jgi:AI-2 transport protein TqsA
MTNDPAASAAARDEPTPPAVAPPTDAIAEVAPPPGPARYGLPRGLIIVLGLAGAVVVAAGIHQVPDILGPVFLALVLTVTVDPIRGLMIRHGAPRWLASLTLVVCVFAILIGLVVGLVVGVAQLATLLPQYAPQIQQDIANLESWLAGFGISQSDIQSMTSNISSSSIISAIEALLTSVTGVLTSLFFVLVLVIFLGLDGSVFGDRMNRVRAGHEPVLGALGKFAKGTRRYFGVATVFGGIVAVLDGIGLVILGIPAAGLWALLAFITNYVPNIGFIIGLIPPALLGLVTGGPSAMIEVIVLYCVLNLIIQSVIQPKVVGDAVGLTTTMSFLSLIVWAYLLGPLGAILAVPASLLFKAVLLDVDPDARWLQLFFGDEPAFTKKPKAKPTATPAATPEQP